MEHPFRYCNTSCLRYVVHVTERSRCSLPEVKLTNPKDPLRKEICSPTVFHCGCGQLPDNAHQKCYLWCVMVSLCSGGEVVRKQRLCLTSGKTWGGEFLDNSVVVQIASMCVCVDSVPRLVLCDVMLLCVCLAGGMGDCFPASVCCEVVIVILLGLACHTRDGCIFGVNCLHHT